MRQYLSWSLIVCSGLILVQFVCAERIDGGKSLIGNDRAAIVERTIASLSQDAVKRGPAVMRDGSEFYTWTRGDFESRTLEWVARETLKDGEIIELLLYSNNQKDGIQRRWYSGGQLKEEAQYEGGLPHGITRRWDAKGQLIARFQMDHGNGVEREYYPGGVLKFEQPFKKGLADGQRIEMHDNGRVNLIMDYREGRVVRNSFSFNRNGALESIGLHGDNGGQPDVLVRFDPTGETRSIEFYINGESVAADVFEKAAREDATAPPYHRDAREYRDLFTDQYREIVKRYEAMEPVKIPLAEPGV